MIGAIVLTLRHRADVKRQDVVAQMMRDPAKAMELQDVKSGQGLYRRPARRSQGSDSDQGIAVQINVRRYTFDGTQGTHGRALRDTT